MTGKRNLEHSIERLESDVGGSVDRTTISVTADEKQQIEHEQQELDRGTRESFSSETAALIRERTRP